MTTLIKKASFTYDPGSPFVPSVSTVTCTGAPDAPTRAPGVPVSPVDRFMSSGFRPPYTVGYAGSGASFMVVTDRNGQKTLWPKPPSGVSSIKIPLMS